jgi:hypothetical protein
MLTAQQKRRKQKEIDALLDAAVIAVEAGQESTYTCYTIDGICVGSYNSAHSAIIGRYRTMFMPDIPYKWDGWWNGHWSRKHQLQRSLALLLAAEMHATGDL